MVRLSLYRRRIIIFFFLSSPLFLSFFSLLQSSEAFDQCTLRKVYKRSKKWMVGVESNHVHMSGIKIDVAYRHPGSDIARIIRLYSLLRSLSSNLRNSPIRSSPIISRLFYNSSRKKIISNVRLTILIAVPWTVVSDTGSNEPRCNAV